MRPPRRGDPRRNSRPRSPHGSQKSTNAALQPPPSWDASTAAPESSRTATCTSTGTPPRSLNEFGETEWMTSATHPYRLSLVVAYADAYKEASRTACPAPTPPAAAAARDFPRQHLPSPQAGSRPRPSDAASQAPARQRAGPEHRPRRRTPMTTTSEKAIHRKETTRCPASGPLGDPRPRRYHRPAHPRLHLRPGPRWRSYQMAHTGEWSRPVSASSRSATGTASLFRSIVDVLTNGGTTTADGTVIKPSGQAAIRSRS